MLRSCNNKPSLARCVNRRYNKRKLVPEHKLQPHPRSQSSNAELPPPQPRCFLERKSSSRGVQLGGKLFLFHSDARSFIGQYASTDLLFPFISLREQPPKIIGWINPKASRKWKWNRIEEKKEKKKKNSTRHLSRKSSSRSSMIRRSRIARFNKKKKLLTFPPNPFVGRKMGRKCYRIGWKRGRRVT